MKIPIIMAAALAPAAVAAFSGAGQSAGAGERAYMKCYSCHALEPGRTDLEGPSLHAIVGRPVAAERGFDYSPAMRSFAAANPAWTGDLLDRFIADPEALVPGTTMTFTGMRDPAERAALIAWLRGMSGMRR